MHVRVEYFAAARELCGTSCEEIELEGDCTVADALAEIARMHERFAPFAGRMSAAVNGEIATREQALGEGDELVVLPPVAGGAGLVAIRATPLSIDETVASVRSDTCGAVAIFLGVVRDHAEGKPVSRLDYEAHEALALQALERVVAEVEREIEGARVAITHRTGSLSIGELAVVVAAAAPHRDAAFDACRRTIDRAKATAPIWKKEFHPDGAAEWINLASDSRR